MEKKEKKILGMTQDEFRLFRKRYGIAMVMVAMIIILSIVSPTFRTAGNVVSIALQVSINGILALGVVFVITAGGIDLSIGSMLALTSVIIGLVLNATGSIPLACIVSVAATTFCGFVNGALIAKFNMFPFVVTLSTQLVIRGLGYVLSGGYSMSLANADFKMIGAGKLAGIPYPVFIWLAVAVMAYLLMHWTKFGRYIYAVGGNINAAEASGVDVFWTRTKSFVISGFCTGVAGIIMIYNGMNLLGISSYWQTITKGLLIIGAVMLDMFTNKRK